MKPLNKSDIKVGTSVYNRLQPLKKGVVKVVDVGNVSTIYWVDCGGEFLNIMCELDIELEELCND
jgi:hypothetical protein